MNSQIKEDNKENKSPEEELNKLNIKALKKLATSRNISYTYNLNKNEIIQALKHVKMPTEIENTNVDLENVRCTRSRTRMLLKNSDNIPESTQDSRNCIDDENTAKATTTAVSKGKKLKKQDEDVKLESRLPQQFELRTFPLKEITNNQDSKTSRGEKNKNTRKGSKTKLPSTRITETETAFSSNKPINKSKDTSVQELKTDSINTKNEADELIKAPQEESRVQMEETPVQLPEKESSNEKEMPVPEIPVRGSKFVLDSSAVSKPTKGETINHFGFKRVQKTEANKIAGKKLPPSNLETNKEKDRKYLQGVRMNKRWLLQMEFRMAESNK